MSKPLAFVIRMSSLSILLVGALLLAAPRPAGACSPMRNAPFETDPEEQVVDTTPPAAPEVALTHLGRGSVPDCDNGCGMCSNACNALGSIMITIIEAEDDRTPFEQMGFRLELLDGEWPEEMYLEDYDIRIEQESIYLHWNDGAKDDQESIDFTLGIRSLDLAGNASAQAAELRITHPGRSGCSTGGFGLGPGALFLLLMVLVSRAGRPRSRSRKCL